MPRVLSTTLLAYSEDLGHPVYKIAVIKTRLRPANCMFFARNGKQRGNEKYKLFFVRSLSLRLNSIQVTRSRGSFLITLPVATQTQRRCVYVCEKNFDQRLQTLLVHCTHSAKNIALRMISLDFSVFLEAYSVSPRQLFFSI